MGYIALLMFVIFYIYAAMGSMLFAVIVISALTVGAHTYSLHPTAELALHWMDLGITVFFLVELVIRFIASRGFKDFFSKGWNIFDFIIVVGSLYPAAGSTLFIARLLRIFRVLRLVSMIPELRLLANSLTLLSQLVTR